MLKLKAQYNDKILHGLKPINNKVTTYTATPLGKSRSGQTNWHSRKHKIRW